MVSKIFGGKELRRVRVYKGNLSTEGEGSRQPRRYLDEAESERTILKWDIFYLL